MACLPGGILYWTVLDSVVVVVEDEVWTPPPMLSAPREKPMVTLVVMLSETWVEPPRVTETSSVAPPQLGVGMWVVSSGRWLRIREGERKRERGRT